MDTIVSIIIPTYNRCSLIGETLDAILKQRYQQWECLVIDDHSTDYTEEILNFYSEKDLRIKYFKRPKGLPKGANSCRNFGFEISSGEYINWFDSDDVMLPDFITKKMDNIRSDQELLICAGYYVDHDLNVLREMPIFNNPDLYKGLVLWENQIITGCVIFKKKFLEDKKLFDTNIFRGQEMEFFSRIFFNLPKSSYQIIDEQLFLYREHEDSITTKNKNYIKKYVESQTFTALVNLKRGVTMNDSDIIKFCYSTLINYFFRGLEFSHKKNSVDILLKMAPILFKYHKKLSLEFLIYGSLLLIIGRGSHMIERKFRLAI